MECYKPILMDWYAYNKDLALLNFQNCNVKSGWPLDRENREFFC